ncbi:MAG: hypothetical protein HY402_00630 [Elusimicrobia bacterium]|nr:hypothetical protein [Elusimicrobiota bacterium]
MRMKKAAYLLLCGALLEPLGLVLWAQSSLSQRMRQAIELYERKKDEEAVDLFMEIMVEGSPGEKNLANEYLNRLILRMSRGEETLPPPRPAASAPLPPELEAPTPQEPMPLKTKGPRPASRRSPQTLEDQREMMREDIAKKLEKLRAGSLRRLQGVESIKIVREGERLAGLGIPSGLLFGRDISFRMPSANRILEPLTQLVFASGESIVHLFPEQREKKGQLMDMRRAVALGTHLIRSGVSPVRIHAELGGSSTPPAALLHFPGIVLHFEPVSAFSLETAALKGNGGGPSVSLGVFPASFNPEQEEGVLIEFSATSAEGMGSWRFELLSKVGGETVVLQEIVGTKPAFHQVFWNGRRKYFGDLVSAGRYECILKAADIRGTSNAVRRWIQVRRTEEPKPEPRTPTVIRSGSPTAEERRAQKGPPVKPPAVSPAAPAVAASPAAVPEKKPLSAAVRYLVYFPLNRVEIDGDGERVLQQVIDAANLYPLEKLNLVGYANKTELRPTTLARRRAEVIASLLVERYKVAPNRISLDARVGGSQWDRKVEVYIAR